jgi:hypothetical protein
MSLSTACNEAQTLSTAFFLVNTEHYTAISHRLLSLPTKQKVCSCSCDVSALANLKALTIMPAPTLGQAFTVVVFPIVALAHAVMPAHTMVQALAVALLSFTC